MARTGAPPCHRSASCLPVCWRLAAGWLAVESGNKRAFRLLSILHFYDVGDGTAEDLQYVPFAYKMDVTSQDFTSWQPFEVEFCGQARRPPVGCCLVYWLPGLQAPHA